MVKLEERKSEYLSGNNSKTGEIVTILDSGTAVKGQWGDGYKFQVERNKEKLSYTPNSTAMEVFKTAWGLETDQWIGKQFKCIVEEATKLGKPANKLFAEVVKSAQVEEEEVQ